MQKNTKNERLLVEEYFSCPRYSYKVEEGFILKEIPCGDIYIRNESTSKNYILALLSGSMEFKCEQHPTRIVQAGEMFMLSRSSIVQSRCIEDARMMIFFFEIPTTNCSKINFQELREIAKGFTCNFNVLPIRKPLETFFSLLGTYLKVGASCAHLHAVKRIEILLCLRYFYTKEELALLFYPMLYKRYDFRHLVLANYERVKSVKELVELSHMSKSVFFENFKQEFGMSAKQWMLAKKTQKIEYAALEPGVTVKNLMQTFDFDSLSSFQRFCKQQIGCSPTELINRSPRVKANE